MYLPIRGTRSPHRTIVTGIQHQIAVFCVIAICRSIRCSGVPEWSVAMTFTPLFANSAGSLSWPTPKPIPVFPSFNKPFSCKICAITAFCQNLFAFSECPSRLSLFYFSSFAQRLYQSVLKSENNKEWLRIMNFPRICYLTYDTGLCDRLKDFANKSLIISFNHFIIILTTRVSSNIIRYYLNVVLRANENYFFIFFI